MKTCILVGTTLLMGTLALPITAHHDEPTAPAQQLAIISPAIPTTQPAGDLAAWIRQLGDDDFHVRLDAAHKLKTIGKPAVPALQEARKSQDPEVHARVEEILEEIERPPVNFSPVPQPTGFGAHSYSVSVLNREKTVNVTEPGRTIHIEEGAAGIVMKVTGQIDGKQATSEYKAKSADQLKKDNPAAFALWAQYAGGGIGNGRIGFGNRMVLRQQVMVNVNGGAGGLVVGPGQPLQQLIRPNAHGDNLEGLEQKILEQMKARNLPDGQQEEVKGLLKQLREGLPVTERNNKADNDVDAQLREYNRQCDALRKRLRELKLTDPGDVLPPPASGRLGISAAEATVAGEGLTITHILPDSRAARLGLKEQDIILKVNGHDVHSTGELRRLVTDNPTGLVVEGRRDGKPLKLEENKQQQ